MWEAGGPKFLKTMQSSMELIRVNQELVFWVYESFIAYKSKNLEDRTQVGNSRFSEILTIAGKSSKSKV